MITQQQQFKFNYPGVESGWRMSGIELTPELFAGFRIMERTAAKAFRERKA